jgi:hypothetical protein
MRRNCGYNAFRERTHFRAWLLAESVMGMMVEEAGDQFAAEATS